MPLKASVIGAGWFACECHIPALAARPDVVLDGVCRMGTEELARAKDAFGFAFASEDYRAVLDRAPDIVVVASPHKFHFAHAHAALSAGAHVLCEKPMCLDPDEAWTLVRLAREQGRHLLIANTYHYLPHVADLRERILSGLVGEIEQVTCAFISATRDVFAGPRGLDRWQRAFFRPDDDTWRDPSAGGGFAYGQLSHSLALMYFLTGRTPATTSAMSLMREGVDIADAGHIVLDNGAVATVSGAGSMPQGRRALMRLFIAGSEGLVAAEFDLDRCVIHRTDGREEALPLRPGDWALDNAAPVHALADLAMGRGTNLSPGDIGAVTTATVAAMLASAAANGEPRPIAGERP